jgi:hypothetical protein
MSTFDWRSATGNLLERFPDNVRGVEAWQAFIRRLSELMRRTDIGGHEYYGALHGIFDEYIGALDDVQKENPSPECCVFVSHKRCDEDLAARIAWIAVQKGFDYWLDVHDPVLPVIAGSAIPSPLRETIVAAFVEMALLNATHLIAVHTLRSHTSLWVPYEIGRAKSRDIWSSQVSGWFEPGQVAPIAGEYTYLMEQLANRADIDRWLAAQPVNHPPYCTVPKGTWKRPEEPPKLPSE